MAALLELSFHFGFLALLFPQTQCAEQVVHRHIRHGLSRLGGATANVRKERDLVPDIGGKQGMIRVDACKKNSPINTPKG